jgi:hypothetical protein
LRKFVRTSRTGDKEVIEIAYNKIMMYRVHLGYVTERTIYPITGKIDFERLEKIGYKEE